jgi:two-component system sensor histidine kinase/response regulator
MTGNPELVTPRRVMEDGADDFLVKPVSLHDLFASIEARFKRAFISWRVEDEMLSQLRTAMPSQLPHEIFTPLAGIIGLLEIVRSDSSGLNPSEINEIHEDMYLSAFRLHRTLRNYLLLLDLQNSAVESAGGGLDARRVEESVRGGVTSALRLNKRKEDIGIRVEECSLPVKAGDLTQIVEELVDNACKFSRQGTRIEVILSAAGELTVSDKGRGMTAEQITRIGLFRQFERQKHEQQGLGLGLVLVQKLAARSHANLLVESELGHGTRAIVSFTKLTI